MRGQGRAIISDDRIISVACIQFRPDVGGEKRNVATSIERIETAAANGAQLVVLSELCNVKA